MKRPLIGLIVCVAAFFAAREMIYRFGDPFSRFGVKLPSRATSGVRPVQVQTVMTSLPPLSNVVFHPPHQPKSKPKPAPTTLPTEPPDSSASLASAQSTNDVPAQNAAALAAVLQSSDSSLRDPLARMALTLVGIDPVAEEYWAAAINDPTLSNKEREDLIEDLNEAGFADPQNPTPDELPLILNRLQLIEEYAPASMDENNARSFAEAYKDLSNMLSRFTAQ
jgi:hypothetical protein